MFSFKSFFLSKGISATLGSGIYILSGTVITQYSGPAVIISFIIAAFATYLSGLCYAELASKVPRSGSAYVYCYVTIGEFVAFIMGWSLLMGYVIGVSATANSLSNYINSVSNNVISDYLKSAVPMQAKGLAEYADFLAFLLCIAVTSKMNFFHNMVWFRVKFKSNFYHCLMFRVLVFIGVKESTFLNKIFSVLNLVVIFAITIIGATKLNSANWKILIEVNNFVSFFKLLKGLFFLYRKKESSVNHTNSSGVCFKDVRPCGKGYFEMIFIKSFLIKVQFSDFQRGFCTVWCEWNYKRRCSMLLRLYRFI